MLKGNFRIQHIECTSYKGTKENKTQNKSRIQEEKLTSSAQPPSHPTISLTYHHHLEPRNPDNGDFKVSIKLMHPRRLKNEHN